MLLAGCIYLLSCCRFVYMSHIVGLISLPSVFIDPSILTFHLNGIIRYVTLCVWILSFSIIFSRLVFRFPFYLPCRGTSSSPLSTPFPFVLLRRMIVGTRSWLILSFLFAFWPNHPPSPALLTGLLREALWVPWQFQLSGLPYLHPNKTSLVCILSSGNLGESEE